jgi:hypothetical protein
MKPSSYPSELHSWALTEATNSMAQLPFVACPEGSIPILQDRKDGKIDISNYHPMDNAGKGEVRYNILARVEHQLSTQLALCVQCY